MTYVFQTHPKWKYHESGDSCIVADEAEEAALGEGWHDLPIEPQLVQTRADLEAKANALGIKIDRRWSDATLKSKIDEATAPVADQPGA